MMDIRRMPGKRWKGGVKGWEESMTKCLGELKKSLAMPATSSSEREVDRYLREASFASARFDMGLFEWWLGHEAEARDLFGEAATCFAALLERWLPTARNPANFTENAQSGAIAASLSGNTQLAQKLFAQTELLTLIRITDEPEPPKYHTLVLDHANVQLPYIRVYCLLRLGRLSGFGGFVYTVPLEQARKATPVWQSIDIHQALDTANFCFELWRKERHGLDSLKKKKFEPLLRALAHCLSPGAGEPERLVARKALQAYQDGISDLHYFLEMYPRVLDLRTAYPHIFG